MEEIECPCCGATIQVDMHVDVSVWAVRGTPSDKAEVAPPSEAERDQAWEDAARLFRVGYDTERAQRLGASKHVLERLESLREKS